MKNYLLVILSCMILLISCGKNEEKDQLSNSLAKSLNLNEKLEFLIIYSDAKNIQAATQQVARATGCTKSSIIRIMTGETLPSTLMQNEVDNVFREALKKTNLKKLDKTISFWDRYFFVWNSPDTTDLYTQTINPLYEEIP